MAGRTLRTHPRGLRLHIPSSSVPSLVESAPVRPGQRATFSGGHPEPRHGGQVPAKPGQSGGVRGQGAVHGGGQSFHFEEQGEDGGVFGSTVHDRGPRGAQDNQQTGHCQGAGHSTSHLRGAPHPAAGRGQNQPEHQDFGHGH